MILFLLIYFIAYLIYCTIKNGKMLESFSQTAYVINKYQFLLTFWIIGFIMFYYISQIYIVLAILFTLGICLVGMSPCYHVINKYLHWFGGILSGVSSQIFVGLINPWLFLAWIPLVIYAIFNKKDDKIFWAEVICMVTLMLVLL